MIKKTRRGTICLSTGTGKSKVAIDLIEQDDSITEVLITSPRTNLKENWKKEFIKWGWEEWTDGMWAKGSKAVNITIENIQTCYKWSGKAYHLLIADEIHTMMTPEYSLLFEHNVFGNVFGLTATHDITDKNDKWLYYDKYAPVIFEYYDSAQHGLINKTRYFVVNHHLNDMDTVLVKTSKTQFTKGELEHYNYLTERIRKGQQLMLQQGSNDWFSDAANWFWKGMGDKEQKFAAMMYLNSIKYRKEFLQNLSSTAKLARRIKDGILAADNDAKVLIFSELTKQIERITASTIHSHNSEAVNRLRMDEFDQGKRRELGSCQSLTLGLNLKGATHAIMESYVGSSTRSKQKKGRLDRLKSDEIADMWIIRVVGTQSEKWFESMSKNLITGVDDYMEIQSHVILDGKFDYSTGNVRIDT